VARDEQGAREGTDDPIPHGSGGDADDSAAPTPHGDGEAADLQFYVLYLTRAHRDRPVRRDSLCHTRARGADRLVSG
jgi:hypothetical protein